ncbi:MAG: hypothetical protein AB7G51_08485 [Steroidobacteraceae bacterium]
MDDAKFFRTRDALVSAMGWTSGAASDFARRELTAADRAKFDQVFAACDAAVREIVAEARAAANPQPAVDVAPEA